MDQEFGSRALVDAHAGDAGGHGVRQRAGAGPAARVVADQADRLKRIVQFLHHQEGMAAPAADQFGCLRQSGGNDIAGVVVGVLDPDLGRAGLQRSFAGRHDFGGHLLAERIVFRFGQVGFIPMGHAGDPFDIGTDVDFHGYALGECANRIWRFAPTASA